MLLPVLALISGLTFNQSDTLPLSNDLGNHHYRVTTRAPLAQQYFDQGMRLYYAFNHAEAIRAFRAAQRIDPSCAMCFWGEALAYGPNINLPMDEASAAAAHTAIERARDAVHSGIEASERDLISALASRYSATIDASRGALDSAYARAMSVLVQRYSSNHDIAVLYAESEMNLRPWDYWLDENQLIPAMAVAVSQLESVMRANPAHPGACHFFIHAVEAKQPKRAVECAEKLASLMPGAGHLVHMPGHIYIRVGRYIDAIRANEHAVHADETYIRDRKPGAGMYTLGYYPHNYDFLAFAAAMAGRRSQSLDAADQLARIAPKELITEPGMTFAQHHITRHLQMRVWFEAWSEILVSPAPDTSWHHARGMWHYARGRAFVGTGMLDEAERELNALRAVLRIPALRETRLEFNTSADVLRIAEQVLTGVHASAGRRHDEAVIFLTSAGHSESALTYGEPPEWSMPVLQDLGAVLLAANRAIEAERAYRADLRSFPDNVWSLDGLEKSLRAQGNLTEANQILEALRSARRLNESQTQPPQ